jgi:hypothetical protein
MSSEVATKYDIPPDLIGFFAKPPILISENRRDYEQMLKGMIELIEPNNTLEWILVRDLVDVTWENRRLGKMKAALVNVTWKEAVRRILESLLEGTLEERSHAAQEQAEACLTDEGRGAVQKILGLHNLTEDAIAAQAMAVRLPELDVIDRQMERARVTRMAIARDIQHHRTAGSWKKPDDPLRIVDDTAGAIPHNPCSKPTALPS